MFDCFFLVCSGVDMEHKLILFLSKGLRSYFFKRIFLQHLLLLLSNKVESTCVTNWKHLSHDIAKAPWIMIIFCALMFQCLFITAISLKKNKLQGCCGMQRKWKYAFSFFRFRLVTQLPGNTISLYQPYYQYREKTDCVIVIFSGLCLKLLKWTDTVRNGWY